MACMRTYVLSIVLMMLPLAAHAGGKIGTFLNN